jgi:hypothetical protein
MAVTVRYRAVPDRIQSYLSFWLVLNPPPPALVGFGRGSKCAIFG